MIDPGVAFFATLICTAAYAPFLRRIALRLRVTEIQGAHKIQPRAVPPWGGVAVSLGLISGLVATWLVRVSPSVGALGPRPEMVASVAIAAMLAMILGCVDDARGLRARTKFFGQVLIATGLCAVGVRLETIDLSSEHTLELGVWSWPITILWIVGVTNALNLIDGFDGLATGIAWVASLTLCVVGFRGSDAGLMLLAAAVTGGLTAFWLFNRPPARLYLGDSGSLSLGVLIAGLAIVGVHGNPRWTSLGAPLLALAIPILDAMFSIVRRLLERRSPFSPDLGHIHHHLSERWKAPGRVLVGLLGMTGALALIGVALLWLGPVSAVWTFAFGAAAAVAFFIVTGHVKPAATVLGLVGLWRLLGERRADRKAFDAFELRLRRAETPEEWWTLVRQAGERFGFESLTIRISGNGTGWTWTDHNGHPAADHILRMRVALSADDDRDLEGELPVRGSMVSAARRFALFSRLVHRHRGLPPGEAP
ncbi:MAG: MraY family glycosyltransferase [Planctomycetota bacterium]